MIGDINPLRFLLRRCFLPLEEGESCLEETREQYMAANCLSFVLGCPRFFVAVGFLVALVLYIILVGVSKPIH